MPQKNEKSGQRSRLGRKVVYSVGGPALFGLFPIVFLYSRNSQEVAAGALLVPCLVVILTSAVTFSLANLIYRNWTKSSIAVVVFWVFFFLYGPVIDNAHKVLPTNLPSHLYTLSLWTLLFLVPLVALKRIKFSLNNLLQAVLVAGMILVGVQLVQTANTSSNYATDLSSYILNKDVSDLRPTDHRHNPDIYYIMPDGYPRSDTLKQYFDFDNKQFEDFLIQNDFYVATKSHSNYNQTAISNPATLNMSYIGEFSRDDKQYKDKLFELYMNNEVFKYFDNLNYSIINNSNWHVTKLNPHADFNVDCEASNELLIELLDYTVLRPFNPLAKSTRGDLRKNAQCTLDNINAGGQSPKLVFTHLLPPHPPYLFKENGEDAQEVNLKLSSIDRWRAKSPYLAQLKFINKRLSETVADILANAKNEPIIIIQSDHGTLSSSENALGDTSTPVLKERSRNFLAIHLPNYCDRSKLYSSMTNVNTFRVILNSCFGQALKILPDTVYYNVPEAYRNFRDITEIVKD